MWSHCIRKEGREAGCHRAKCMSMVTICQARRVPIVAVLTIRNQVAHQGLQGHVAPRTKAFYRRTGLLLSPNSTEQKWQILQTPFNPADVNMCELDSNTKLPPALPRITLGISTTYMQYMQVCTVWCTCCLSNFCFNPHLVVELVSWCWYIKLQKIKHQGLFRQDPTSKSKLFWNILSPWIYAACFLHFRHSHAESYLLNLSVHSRVSSAMRESLVWLQRCIDVELMVHKRKKNRS